MTYHEQVALVAEHEKQIQELKARIDTKQSEKPEENWTHINPDIARACV